MALFVKKADTSSPPLYSLGLNRTVLIVGLGNPGKEYDGTRHNIGFACVDAIAEKQEFDSWVEKSDLKCKYTSQTLGNTRVILAKPTTFMNLSGEAVQAVANFYKVPPQQILVVHDELDIPFGQIRTRMGGGSAGHNGVKSVTQHITENYGRVRIGIGPKEPEQMDSADFVLAKFSKEQQESMPALLKEARAIITEFIFGTDLAAETRSFIV
jgi:PTH1 family peptidyl-tRNA hydrolase